MKMKFTFLPLLAALFLSVQLFAQAPADEQARGTIKNKQYHEGYVPSFENDKSRNPVRNVILMIGDGMGLTHVSAGMYANKGVLTMTNLRTIGLVKTQSANKFTTDSAASGTAYSTGSKTNNSALGVDTTGQALANLTEKLTVLGYATGILTTDDLDGATPGAFYAHQPKRNMSAEILGDLAVSDLTFFAGGSKERVKSKRPQLMDELRENGFTVVENSLDKKAASAQRLGIIPPAKKTASVNDNRGNFLPETTEFALEYLSSKSDKGFFIMIEGARIDKSSHENDFPAMVMETLDFDKAVEAAIRFAEKDGNTLVIISADHETGGVSLSTNGNPAKGEVRGYFRSKNHSPVMVPLFAYGPYSDYFGCVQENNDVANKIYELLSTRGN